MSRELNIVAKNFSFKKKWNRYAAQIIDCVPQKIKLAIIEPIRKKKMKREREKMVRADSNFVVIVHWGQEREKAWKGGGSPALIIHSFLQWKKKEGSCKKEKKWEKKTSACTRTQTPPHNNTSKLIIACKLKDKLFFFFCSLSTPAFCLSRISLLLLLLHTASLSLLQHFIFVKTLNFTK